jgi:EEF1A lysine methyltransferase 2
VDWHRLWVSALSNNLKSWDNYYQNDLENDEEEDAHLIEVSELESWFDDVGAPAKTLAFLTSALFPLSPNSPEGANCSPYVLDVGTGNGSALLSLRLEGGYEGPMVGVDYSEQSIQLARKLLHQYSVERDTSTPPASIAFEVFDLIRDDPIKATWWPADTAGFDLVLDKGTFDAISLSSETIADPNGVSKRLFELYPEKIANMLKPKGFFLITSCNWTEDEVIRWFTKGNMRDILEIFHIIKYPVFQFGGQKGQGVASICFRNIEAI